MSFKIVIEENEKQSPKTSPREERIGSGTKEDKTLQRTSSNSVQSLSGRKTSANLEKFQLSNYDFNFESIFLFQDIYDTIYKFLCSELKVKNYRQLDFMMDLQKMEDEIDEKKKDQKALDILNKYLKRGGEMELYVSPSQKQKTIQEFEEATKNSNANYKTLFEPISKVIMIELQRDVAPRFTRSKECKNILKYYMNNLEVLVLKQVKEFPYTDKDFSECLIIEKDFNFMYSFTKDDLCWELSKF